ncbi:MAG: AraC family transcriptional regulator [Pseudomonadota bacterium]
MRFRPVAAALAAIVDLVVELGGDPGPLMAELGLGPGRADEAAFPPRAFQVALGLAARATGRPDFGLALARRRTLDTFGDLGALLESAPSVGDAVDQLFQFLPFGQEAGVRGHVVRRGHEALLVGQVVLSDPPSLDQQIDHLAGAAVGLLRGLTRPDWTPEAVYLTRRRPASTAPYERYFGAPVLFGQETAAIVVRADLLAQPVARANLDRNRLLHAHLRERARSADRSLRDQVRDRIWRGLGDRWRGEAGVAADMGLSRRTLQRRLAREGAPFRRLVEEARLEIAQRMLTQTAAPLVEISAALGYAEPAIFTRFFRRRAGATPTAWRRRATVVPDGGGLRRGLTRPPP